LTESNGRKAVSAAVVKALTTLCDTYELGVRGQPGGLLTVAVANRSEAVGAKASRRARIDGIDAGGLMNPPATASHAVYATDLDAKVRLPGESEQRAHRSGALLLASLGLRSFRHSG